MRQRSNHLWSVISALTFLLVAAAGNTRACGPMLYSDEARFSLFQPTTMDRPALLPFQYTHDRRIKFEIPAPPDDRIRNIQEWLRFGKGQFDSADVWALQYQTSPENFQQALSAKDGGALKDNTFLQWLLKRKNSGALRYFSYAKKVEGAQNPYWENQWDQLFREGIAEEMDSLAAEGFRFLQKEKSAFLKSRYAFQFVKCAYYTAFYGGDRGRKAQAVQAFDRHLSKSNSIVGQWAWIYYADLQADPLTRTRYFLEAFERSDEKKLRAFQLLSRADLDTLLSVEQDPGVRAIALSLLLMKTDGPGLPLLQEVYQLQPGHPYLPLLISREINKLEDWLWSPEILRFQPKQRLDDYYANYHLLPESERSPYEQIARQQWSKDREYLSQLLHFLLKQSHGPHAPNGFLTLAIAHLYNMDDRHRDAAALLKDIPPDAGPSLQLQYYYEKIIALLYTEDTASSPIDREVLAGLLKDLQTLQRTLSEPASDGHRIKRESKLPELYAYLGRHFLDKGEVLSACLLLQKSELLQNEYAYKPYDSTSYGGLAFLEKYASPADIDALIILKHKKDKSPFEQLLSPDIWLVDGMYQDLKGTLLLRSEQYEAAYAVFEAMDDDFWETTYAFADYLPATTVTDLGKRFPAPSGNGLRYKQLGKKPVLKEMLALKAVWEQSSDPREKALAGFHLANALYNISYYGKAWMVSAYGHSASEPFSQRPIYRSNYRWVYYYMPETGYSRPDNYYGLRHAMQLYREVAALESADRETRAGATLMLALCDRLRQAYYQTYPTAGREAALPDALMKAFRRDYADTRLYTAARTHCPDLF